MIGETPFESDVTGHVSDVQARVYVADTDFSGIVYHARYLEFFERGRSEFLRDIGFNNNMFSEDSQAEKLFFVVRHMEVHFLKPAQIDNLLTIKTRINCVKGARFLMDQYILHDNKMLVTAKVQIALINEEGRPRRLPKNFSKVLA
ncbi:tol-pal system-associated acyl-CoA thioesterase [Bartonella sp. CB189]|uniref:tol-pal system-associated acyl-CoA thioesterase n=1 Tax=Bartonella sp. CB189 TaxID=3112254 RepID=UPI002F965776